MSDLAELRFPPGFWWGVATASYQIEGAVKEDGRGPSIWDTFAHTPGKTANGETGDVACDHYHRYPEDVALMADLGITHYRFSIAWPRIQPSGSGTPNARGIDFYSRLVDALLEAGITPSPTLFHWDLPQVLEDQGGFRNRDTAMRFGDYAAIMAETLGDRVKVWMTLNEPFVFTALGHLMGAHAPGLVDPGAMFPVTHHQLLGHGLAVDAVRSTIGSEAQISLAQNLATARPVPGPNGGDDADAAACRSMQMLHLDTFCDPLFLGRYPDGLEELPGFTGSEEWVNDGDLDQIAQPLDFLGVNYYLPDFVSAPAPGSFLPFDLATVDGYKTTEMGWPIVPDGLTELLVTLKERYGDALPPLVITESGTAVPDQVNAEGSVNDPRRIRYHHDHLAAVREAMAQDVAVTGYFAWSLMDNFEWAEGYRPRFGLVHVDYETQTRTPKSSFYWYRDLIASQSGA